MRRYAHAVETRGRLSSRKPGAMSDIRGTINSMTTVRIPTYRGSSKHKNLPAQGMKGTICPEWTHATTSGRLQVDMQQHAWHQTKAQQMFAAALVDPEGRRFATDRGVAFEAKDTKDGTWHGFPIPWEDVPVDILDEFKAIGAVTRRDTRRYWSFERSEITWALETDE